MDVIIYAQFIYILVVELESKQSEITSSPSKPYQYREYTKVHQMMGNIDWEIDRL